MRSLYIIPIVHSAADLGRLELRLESLKTSLMPRERIDASRRAVQMFWSELQLAIETWSLEFDKLNVYQDALPYSPIAEIGIEQKIVSDLAAIGSPNHILLKWLLNRGAHLLGTESPQLLIAEYTLVKRSLESREVGSSRSNDPAESSTSTSTSTSTNANTNSSNDVQAELGRLLMERDRFIANRIDSTLVDGQRGIIFLGMLHELEQWLPGDIQVEYPIGKPSKAIDQTIHQLSI